MIAAAFAAAAAAAAAHYSSAVLLLWYLQLNLQWVLIQLRTLRMKLQMKLRMQLLADVFCVPCCRTVCDAEGMVMMFC